jgi:hypothetical protein
MATTHSAPIDLYEESHEGFAEDQHPVGERSATEERRPAANGDRDQPAIDDGQVRLQQVLGW